jgi:uncharacterized membrane protein
MPAQPVRPRVDAPDTPDAAARPRAATADLQVCSVCGKRATCRPAGALRPSLLAHLQKEGFDPHEDAASVCSACVTGALSRHTLAEVRRRKGKLSDVEEEIARRATAIADEIEHSVPASFGQRTADAVARIGGSWGFVLGFIGFLIAWAILNGVLLASDAVDPYPFILLNLMLSCLASVQAPIILMAQTRMSELDRIRATEDLRVNLKAEIEVAALHEKMDHLLHQQWQRLLALQTAQMEILHELRHEATKGNATSA